MMGSLVCGGVRRRLVLLLLVSAQLVVLSDVVYARCWDRPPVSCCEPDAYGGGCCSCGPCWDSYTSWYACSVCSPMGGEGVEYVDFTVSACEVDNGCGCLYQYSCSNCGKCASGTVASKLTCGSFSSCSSGSCWSIPSFSVSYDQTCCDAWTQACTLGMSDVWASYQGIPYSCRSDNTVCCTTANPTCVDVYDNAGGSCDPSQANGYGVKECRECNFNRASPQYGNEFVSDSCLAAGKTGCCWYDTCYDPSEAICIGDRCEPTICPNVDGYSQVGYDPDEDGVLEGCCPGSLQPCDTNGNGMQETCCSGGNICIPKYKLSGSSCVVDTWPAGPPYYGATKMECGDCSTNQEGSNYNCEWYEDPVNNPTEAGDPHPNWFCCNRVCIDADSDNDGADEKACCESDPNQNCGTGVLDIKCGTWTTNFCCDDNGDGIFEAVKAKACGSHTPEFESDNVQHRCETNLIGFAATKYNKCDGTFEECDSSGQVVCDPYTQDCAPGVACLTDAECSPNYLHCGAFSSSASRHGGGPCWCKHTYAELGPDGTPTGVVRSDISPSRRFVPSWECYTHTSACTGCSYATQCCDGHACVLKSTK